MAQAGPSSAGRKRKEAPNAEPRDTRLPSVPPLLCLPLAAGPLGAPDHQTRAKPLVSEPYPDTLRTDVYSTSSVSGKATYIVIPGGGTAFARRETPGCVDTKGMDFVPGSAKRAAIELHYNRATAAVVLASDI